MTDDARPESQPGSAGYPPYGTPSQPPYDPAQPPYGAPYPGIPAQPPPGQPYPVEQQPGGPEPAGWTNSTPPGGMPTVPMAHSPQVPQQPVPDPGWSSQPPPVGQPWPTAPRTDIPRPNQPTSAAPAPVSGSPAPQSGAPYSDPSYPGGYPGPISGAPATQGYPAQGYPAQGHAAQGYGTQGYGAQSYGAPGYQAPAAGAPESLPWGPAGPTPAASGYPGIDNTGARRIVPTPQETKRSRFGLGLVIGLAVAVLAAGGAYFLGSSMGSGSAKPSPSTAASPSLHAFEQNQQQVNAGMLNGDLSQLAQPWLALLSGCLANGDSAGTRLKFVSCYYGGASVHFALYKTVEIRDHERSIREQLHAQSSQLAPGQDDPTTKAGGLTGTQGDYVEYATKGSDGRPLCGIWWDHPGEKTAMYMEALCQQVLGGDWEPLRDLWQRHS